MIESKVSNGCDSPPCDLPGKFSNSPGAPRASLGPSVVIGRTFRARRHFCR
jgi:hypothetical protein